MTRTQDKITKLLAHIRDLRKELLGLPLSTKPLKLERKTLVVHTGHSEYKIFHAITTDNLELVKSITTMASTPNILDITGMSALHYAVILKRANIVKFLIKKGAIPNTKTHQGRSPLYSAYMLEDNNMIEILEKAGAVKMVDSYGWFPS